MEIASSSVNQSIFHSFHISLNTQRLVNHFLSVFQQCFTIKWDQLKRPSLVPVTIWHLYLSKIYLLVGSRLYPYSLLFMYLTSCQVSPFLQQHSNDFMFYCLLNKCKYFIKLKQTERPTFPHWMNAQNSNSSATWAAATKKHLSVHTITKGRCPLNSMLMIFQRENFYPHAAKFSAVQDVVQGLLIPYLDPILWVKWHSSMMNRS